MRAHHKHDGFVKIFNLWSLAKVTIITT